MLSHFQQFRDSIKEILFSHHFHHDIKDFNPDIILKSDVHPYLHKFEKNIQGIHIFRALINKNHIVYAIDKYHRLIFLRSFHNFLEYEKFLSNKKEIIHLVDQI